VTSPKAAAVSLRGDEEDGRDLETAGRAVEVQGDTRSSTKIQDGPPDLQRLVELRGGYDKITPEDWATFDRATSEHHARRRKLLARELAQTFKNPRESASRRRSVPANRSNRQTMKGCQT
jgi:hypothetical protein